jgi:excinuclease ABC subunit C
MAKELNQDRIKSILPGLPNKPGVYQFFDKDEKIIYVGKAKDLKKRVSSYFQKENHENNKVRVLVSKIIDLKYIVVDTESEALLLENNLIKEYQPRYNVLLKDDKTFPWICVKNENFPRVYSTRNLVKDGSQYFGPYTSVVMVRTMMQLIKQLYPLRTCSLDLDLKKISLKKYKPCLEYHLGNCKAPCIELQDLDDYNTNIKLIIDILKGNINTVKKILKDLMLQFAEDHRFEKAQKIKEKIEIIERFQSKSTVVNQSINNVDVFSIIDDEKSAFVNYLKVLDGSVIKVHTVEISKKLEEEKNDLLLMAIIDIREKLISNSTEVIVPFKPDIDIPGVKYNVPKVGDKLKLLEMSERNARYFMNEIRSIDAINKLKDKKTNKLEVLKADLRLKEIPVHIECFDNSNLQGTNPVASCVVFKNLKPSIRDYRHFNVKTVVGPDDYSSMEEIVYRRYKRMLDEGEKLPQLIVIDGGKGQLHAAINSLQKLDIYNDVAVISIAKRLEEIYFPNDPIPLYLNKNSESLRVIQHIRNEAHRFGITFHKTKRSKNFIVSELDSIQGIGPKAKELLLSEFKSVNALKELELSKLEEVLGKAKGKIVYEYFRK